MTPFEADIEAYCKRHGMTSEGSAAVAKEASNMFPNRVLPISNQTRYQLIAEITGGAE